MDVTTRAQFEKAGLDSRSHTRNKNMSEWKAEVLVDDSDVASIFSRLTMSSSQTLEEEAAELGRMLFSRCCLSDKVCEICGKGVKGKKGKVAPCGHYFHVRCLPKQYERDCPTCADTASTEDDASLDAELSPIGGGIWWRP